MNNRTPVMFRTHIYNAAFPGMIGPAEFEQVPEDAEMLRAARELRKDPEFAAKYLAYATAETIHEGWMPKEVWDHARTPTYHRVLSVLLGCEDMSEDDKRARRRQAFLDWLGSDGVNERLMCMPRARMMLTGSPIVTPRAELYKDVDPESPEHEAYKLHELYFPLWSHERKYLRELRGRLLAKDPDGYL